MPGPRLSGSSKPQKLLLQLRRPEAHIGLPAGPLPSRGSGGGCTPALAPSSWWLPALPGGARLVPVSFQFLPPSSQGAFSGCLCVFVRPSYKDPRSGVTSS